MKPTLQFIETNTHHDSSARRPAFSGPKIEQNFRPNSHGDFGGRSHGSSGPSFRRIGNDYFDNEARGHFRSEAAVFLVMIGIAAVPVIEGIKGAVHFLRVGGLL